MLQRILGPWLTAGAQSGRIRPVVLAGLLILIVLAVQVIVFRRIGG